ncbi:MAG: M61 family metallopeptidase [Ignavibacteria bacterium]|nr:MAG: M61 family metallopeptidase [Ignavibacteria bacterium]
MTTGLEGNGRNFPAPDYDYFVDCPIEIGTQKDFTFHVDGIPHVLSISGAGDWNADTLIRDMSKIITTERNFWGEYPYKRYVFLVHCTPRSGGGTEHINSTILGTSPFIFKNPDSYKGFLNLVAHEYFHTWNVKQLRPKGLVPYDYTRENYCRELWIAEGTTSYYDNLMLVRAGFTTPEKYLEGAAASIQSDRQRPGNRVQPLVESSFDAWIKFWREREQSFNLESDYYGKGANISALLDLDIRHRSANKHSLDDVMRSMYKRFPLSGGGYTLADFQGVAEEFAGNSLQHFFNEYVFGTAPLPWEEYLGYAGLKLAKKDSLAKPWIGIATTDAGDRTRVAQVIPGSPAYEAGIDLGDEILALNGYRVRSSDLAERISRLAEGEVVTLTLFQRDHLRECKLKVAHAPVPAYLIVKNSEPTTLQRDIYKGWLGAPLDTGTGSR